MSFRDDLLPLVDEIRAIPGDLGLRRFTVTRITRTYASGTVGRGAAVDTTLVLDNGGQNVKANLATENQISQILGSGHVLKPGTWIIGPITPDFAGGGTSPDGFDVATGTAAQILYKLTGPGLPATGTMFRAAKAAPSSDGKSFRHMMVLEPAANAPNP